MGKSEGNALWLDGDLLSPFDYFQFFRNVDDRDVMKLIKVFTDFTMEEIKAIETRLENGENINEIKKILAFEATKICHGEEVAKDIRERSAKIFESNSFDDLEKKEYKLSADNSIILLLKDLCFVASNGEAKRLIQGGGVKIDDKAIDETFKIIDLKEFKLSVGKKKHYKIIIK